VVRNNEFNGIHDAHRGQKGETDMKPLLFSSLAVMLAAVSAQSAPPGAAEPSVSSPPASTASSAAEDTAIRPFHIQVPEEALTDLRQRIAATRWPDKETVADQSQGAPLAKLQELVRYWGSGYDWRKAEAKLNALPQFMTKIDGLDIHFIHVRSRQKNALPVIITHGWPDPSSSNSKSSVRSRTQPRPAAAPRTHSTSSAPLFRATASPASQPAPVGTPSTSRERGRS
jgi:hypothetical protein